MGNCCVSYRISILPSCVKVDDPSPQKQGKVLKIVKLDGKVLEFTSPTLVKDVLVDFNGFVIGLSKDSSHILSPNFELKMGQVCYLLPAVPSPQSTIFPPLYSFMEDSDTTSSTKRIRIVLTKKELQKLLAKQVSLEELIMQQPTLCSNHISSSSTWKPSLAAIPEEVE